MAKEPDYFPDEFWVTLSDSLTSEAYLPLVAQIKNIPGILQVREFEALPDRLEVRIAEESRLEELMQTVRALPGVVAVTKSPVTGLF